MEFFQFLIYKMFKFVNIYKHFKGLNVLICNRFKDLDVLMYKHISKMFFSLVCYISHLIYSGHLQ